MFGLIDLLSVYETSGPHLNKAGTVVYSGATVDSRQCTPGDFFIALPGEHQDGHDFLEAALNQGCTGALARSSQVSAERRRALAARVYEWRKDHWVPSGPEQAPITLVLVPDPLEALQRLATRWRSRFSPIVVGITGSVGKSSTKELLAAVLSKQFQTLKSERSYNNEIGLPLTLLKLRPQHEVVVAEMGTYGPGEITQLARIARPQIGVVTNVSHSHLERMGTLETIARAKSELPAALPSDGVAILNGDEDLIRAMGQKTRAAVVYYGLQDGCHVRAMQVLSRGLDGFSFQVQAGQERHHLRCGLPGRHNVYNALAGVAVGRHLGLSWDTIEAGLMDPAAQLRLLRVAGAGGSTLIDDTYNASPVSCRAALDLLSELSGRKIAVFGDMMELGSFEEQGHRLVGEWAAAVVDRLIVMGPRARWMGESALAHGMPPSQVDFVENDEQALQLLRNQLQRNDVVLVKGSRAMEMECIVAALRQSEQGGPEHAVTPGISDGSQEVRSCSASAAVQEEV